MEADDPSDDSHALSNICRGYFRLGAIFDFFDHTETIHSGANFLQKRGFGKLRLDEVLGRARVEGVEGKKKGGVHTYGLTHCLHIVLGMHNPLRGVHMVSYFSSVLWGFAVCIPIRKPQ